MILEIECRFGAGMDVQFLVDVLFARLFPDAERAEDGAGQIFRRRFAGDFADGVDGDAQIKFGEI